MMHPENGPGVPREGATTGAVLCSGPVVVVSGHPWWVERAVYAVQDAGDSQDGTRARYDPDPRGGMRSAEKHGGIDGSGLRPTPVGS